MGALLHALHDREPLPAPRVVEVNEITALICRLPQTHENLVALLSCVEGVFSNAMAYVPVLGEAHDHLLDAFAAMDDVTAPDYPAMSLSRRELRDEEDHLERHRERGE